MRTTLLTLAAVLGLAFAAPAQAQLSVELRGSLNNPTGDFGDPGGVQAESEAGFGADLIYNLTPALSVYGGWSREMYGCQGCADDDGLTSSGFEGGVKLLARREGSILPWIRGGLVAHTLEVEEGGFEVESDRGIGLQLAAGADIPLGEVLSFSPAIRYQTYDAEFDVVGGDLVVPEQQVSHLALDFGLHIHLDALQAR